MYLLCGFLLSGIPTKVMYEFLVPFMCATCIAHLILPLITTIMLVAELKYEIRLYTVFSNLVLLPFLEFQYSPRHFVLKDPQFFLFLLGVISNSTRITKNVKGKGKIRSQCLTKYQAMKTYLFLN
jgi:hypothetical protein